LDQFGRALAYVWVADGEQWYLIDEWMVLFGYARAWRDDGQYRDVIIDREGEAAANRADCLWG
jgi:endonuclease YncB( thermonuclease family)